MSLNTEYNWLKCDELASLNELKLSMLAAGEAPIDLSMINPDLEPPRILLDRLIEATLKPKVHRYSVARGVKKLRDAFAKRYRCFGISLDSEKEICVTSGTKDALMDILMCSTTRGDRVLVGTPTYPAYNFLFRHLGLETDFFEILPDQERMLAQIYKKLDERSYSLILLNFPNNPTGLTVSVKFFSQLAERVKGTQIRIVNDFVYGEMVFDHKHGVSLLSAANIHPKLVETYSLSKAYSVPGWRIGAALGELELIGRLHQLKSKIDYGIFMPLQMAAAAVLGVDDDLTRIATESYSRRCRLLEVGLRKLNFEIVSAQAGACVWAKLPNEISLDSIDFSLELLRKSGVVVSPGQLFGAPWSRYLRLAVVRSEFELQQVLVRMKNMIDSAWRTDNESCAK